MAWFVVKEVKEGAIFGYKIHNHIVEVVDAGQMAELRKEPVRFLEVADKKEAAKTAASFTSETEVIPADTDEDEEEVEEEVDLTQLKKSELQEIFDKLYEEKQPDCDLKANPTKADLIQLIDDLREL